MPCEKTKSCLFQYRNCRLLRDHQLVTDDLWVRDGKIMDPEKLFFEEKVNADLQIDCNGNIISPGFIESQINGGFGIDFSKCKGSVREGLKKVARGILAHGVTSFCPTMISSPKETYHKTLPEMKKFDGSKEGAGMLGIHLEGPFISREKKGAHPEQYICSFDGGFQDLLDMYGSLDDVAIVTLAPEHEKSKEVIQQLVSRGIIVSLGHTICSLVQGEEAVHQGATFITHLFNAMLPFHHRDPHLVGLLTSQKLPKGIQVYYGIISDGIHTHPAALRIAQRVNPEGTVLITDAIQAMGLPAGKYILGEQEIEIQGKIAVIAGTDTLSGSIATMDTVVKHYAKATACGMVEALEAATLHPAKLLRITDRKGTLDYETDADFVILNDRLEPQATYIAGDLVWELPSGKTFKVKKVEK
ncbi:N-acetylglucosamine-6-phosphate deacetylase-like [Gigantopelta aegis]|uniref:N-acetylglucosamine-6-phosphate deacetylase-like n=1 Tax=Gigantopelta aegis TaxID=1735272 RepID=UPI001B88C6A7|nr:N-acetylglucosamine-6-phosphate deacetylase-like [Gigantopelta aegis]